MITPSWAEALVTQLEQVKAKGTLVELWAATVDKDTCYQRNTAVLEGADWLAAFQVNHSAGTQDTIDKALARGMHVDCSCPAGRETGIESWHPLPRISLLRLVGRRQL